MNALVKLEKAAQLLAEVRNAGDAKGAKQIKNAAEAAELYARKQKSDESTLYAHGIKVEAGAVIGEVWLREGKKKGQKAQQNKSVTSHGLARAEFCKLVGTSDNELRADEFLARLQAKHPEAYISIWEGKKTPKVVRCELRKAKQRAKEEEAVSSLKVGEKTWNITVEQAVVQCSAVITDPPYGILDEPWEPKELKEFTITWLQPWNDCGADTFLIFWSQAHMWVGREWFDQHLTNYQFQQLLVWNYRNNKSPQSRMGFKQTWEPVFFYRRKDSTRQVKVSGAEWGEDLHDFDCYDAAVPQSNFNGQNRKEHPAQKPVEVFRWLINAVTQPGELVCDPFCGSGTSGIAATQLKRRYHGIEIDPTFLKLASQRIAAYGVQKPTN